MIKNMFKNYVKEIKNETKNTKNEISKSSPGAYGGPPKGQRRALQKFDGPKITKIFIFKMTKSRNFKDRSKSLRNHLTNIFRPVENRVAVKNDVKIIMNSSKSI